MINILKIKIRLPEIILSVIFLITSLQFSACSRGQQTNTANSVAENKPNNESTQNTEQSNKSVQDIAADVEKNRNLWLEKKISNYDMTASFVMEEVNFSADPVLLRVRDGKSISIEPVSSSDKRSIMLYKRYETVDKMFEVIKQESVKETSIHVIYNKEFGYPESISFAYQKKTAHAWSSFKITKFEIIK